MARTKKYKLPSNYMDIVYEKRIPFHKGESGMITLDVENRGFYNAIAQKIFRKPRFSRISLDKYGSVVWECIDGNKTVYDILEKMKTSFPAEQDRMLDRLAQFLRILEVNEYIKKKV